MTQRDCDDCHYRELEPAEEPCKHCNATDAGFTNWKKRDRSTMTNADRIRSMSDEEMAEFIPKELAHVPTSGFEIAIPAWLKWLQQPAEEVEHG